MRIVIASPVAAGSSRGNGVTARRWRDLLADLGHEVRLQGTGPVDLDCDLLVALHARKAAATIRGYRRSHPGRPVVLAMTGTDLYRDLPDDPDARDSVAVAERIVVLHPLAVNALPVACRDKARVILQSVAGGKRLPRPPGDPLAVCVLAHLRPVKDPLLAARAVALLPPDRAVQVTLAGASLEPGWDEQARDEERRNPRFRWVGELSPAAATALLLAADVLVISSLAEGGANAVGEAIVAGVPVLASRIDGNVGLLGADYPGCFPAGDATALAALLDRAATEPESLAALTARLDGLRPLFAPARERDAWRRLLGELAPLESP